MRPKSRPQGPQKPGSRHRFSTEKFTFEEANDRLKDYLKHHGFPTLSHEKRLLLARFYFLLMEEQTHQNFTRLHKLRDIAIKHFVDSMIVAELTELTFPLLDMGTGPGFPGIPLKVYLPEQKIVLAEGVQKRVEFLKKVREELQLPNLDIIGRNVNSNFMYPVQGVITRAVEDVGNTLGNVIQCVQTGGKVFLMKGPKVDPEIKDAEKGPWAEYYKLTEDHAYTLPNSPHDRRLLVYTKIKAAPIVDLKDEEWGDD